MEQTDSCEGHCHSIFIAAFDHCIITHGTSWLCYVLHTALMRSFDIVGEGEEGV